MESSTKKRKVTTRIRRITSKTDISVDKQILIQNRPKWFFTDDDN